MWNRSCFTEEEMGYGRQSRQNRKENSARNWTFRLHKMQKNLPHHPKQKEDLRLVETDSTPTPSLFFRTFRVQNTWCLNVCLALMFHTACLLFCKHYFNG